MKNFIHIKGLSKHFGDFVAVDKVNLEIGKGELFSILGGSGCGKSTLLRMLAGLEVPTSGSIEIDGTDITRMAPYDRPVNMMFQSYAIFPHMNVARNVGYGLRKDGVGKAEIEKRVDQILELVQLSEYKTRKPDQLSGGQRQRVALARALIKRPKVLLLDEPLAALDKKLRERTQFELMNIQYELGITFIVVTHDQEEAMTLSTRIAVMDKGRFQQVGTPKEVYEFPTNRFVANFIGTINTFEGVVTVVEEDKIQAYCDEAGETLTALGRQLVEVGQTIGVAVRPEKIFVSKERPDNQEDVCIQGVVDDLGYLGNRSLYRIKLGNGRIVQVSSQNRRRSVTRFLEWGDKVWISWTARSAVVLLD
ncbi:MAG: ABC transporter ATP-binding protein [Gammaproteobacteria bacterium]|nr:ABC transporter ATP-binding protein [Gammaproteobacteria bacterium]MDH5241007.1 ABC transporter ATP-binding protein [Gammaproteobacteria bacterium]MDH5259847.1 ABC transporter ATP-binding protein [Gammaproteobacteria bacterium]MDH5583838.1 ABC transporter ATP-binding protein [Gammaproteobacteria bacterium]